MDESKQKAFNNLVTMICKECQEHGFTLKELEKVPSLIKDFYFDNAMPYKDKRD